MEKFERVFLLYRNWKMAPSLYVFPLKPSMATHLIGRFILFHVLVLYANLEAN